MRRLLWITLFLSITLALLMAGIRGVGSAQPLRLADMLIPQGYKDCTPPCWRGILPGRESVETARDKLLIDPAFMQQASALNFVEDLTGKRFCGDLRTVEVNWNVCMERIAPVDGPTRVIRFVLNKQMSLGHALLLLGEPVASRLCMRLDGSIAAEVYFEHFVVLRASGSKYDPGQMKVTAIEYMYPSTDPAYLFDLTRWNGFQTPLAAPTCY